MGKYYRQIDLEERCQLRGMMEQGFSITKIARHLGRDRRTIQRELARNRTAKGEYKPDTASRFSWARRLRGSRCQRCSQLHEIVTSSLAMGWTPQQISGWLHHDNDVPTVSHESIYRYIYMPQGRQLKLSRYLPHHHAKRGYRRRKGERKIPIPDRVPIDQRPQEANDRRQVILSKWGTGRATWFTSQARATFSSLCRNASPAIGSCNECHDAIVRPFPTPSLPHSSLFQSICARPSPTTTVASLQNTKSYKKNWAYPPIFASLTARGREVPLKMAMVDCASTCLAKPNSMTTQIRTFRTWLFYTTTHPENVWDIKRQHKQS